MSIVVLATANSYYRATMQCYLLFYIILQKKSIQISNPAFLLGSAIQKGASFLKNDLIQSRLRSYYVLDFLALDIFLLSNESGLFRSTTLESNGYVS